VKRVVVLIAVAVGLAAPETAAAHARLVTAAPATQARVDTAPTEVRLEFDQAVTASSTAIQVLAADGRVLSGPARSEDGGRVVVTPLTRLASGEAYTVRWRVLGDDGHAPSGVYTFGVGIPAPPPTTAVGASGTSVKDDLARWVVFGSLALLIGPLVLRLLVLRGPVPDRLEREFHVVGVVAAFLVIDAGIAAFVLRASNALQLPLGDLAYGDLQPFAEKTRFGIAFLAMTVGFGIVAALLLVGWIMDRPELRWPALLLSIGLASGFSLSSHQATEPNASSAAQVADWVHLVAASVWVGGVAALAFVVWPSAPALRRRAFLGFARLALVLVGALVAAGTYLAFLRLSEPAALWETSYGRFLLLKLALVAVALVWGAVHHLLVRPRLVEGREPRVGPSLAGEAAVAFAVLLAAAILTNVAPPPPADAPATTARSSR
jgi:copper transport protein